jgi:hypothetical protein
MAVVVVTVLVEAVVLGVVMKQVEINCIDTS